MSESKFVLSDELDTLEYDFRPYTQAHGVIPEPSTAQIETFQQQTRTAMAPLLERQVADSGKTDIEQLQAALAEDVDEADAASKARETAMQAAMGEVCSGTPSAQDIADLPFRAQRAFSGWLIGTLLVPKE